MNRYIWAFAAVALAVIATVGFILLRPTAERPNNQRPMERSVPPADSRPEAEAGT